MHDDILSAAEQILVSRWAATEDQEATEPMAPSFEATEDEANEVIAAACKILKEESVELEASRIIRCQCEDNEIVVYVVTGVATYSSGRESTVRMTLCRPNKDAPPAAMKIEVIMERRMAAPAIHFIGPDEDIMKALLARVMTRAIDKEPVTSVEEPTQVEVKLSWLGRVSAWLRRRA
jgi:hypothetical protein